MAADGVVGQRRSVRVLLRDDAARHKPKLDKRLEAVAYAKDQAVSLI